MHRPPRFFRYLAVGAFATAVHYALLAALVEFAGWPPSWAAAAGAWVGAQVGFAGDARLTFASPWTWASWRRFQVVAAIGAVLSFVLVRVGVGLGAHYLVAQLVATGVTVFVTFEVNRRWSFAPPPGSTTRR